MPRQSTPLLVKNCAHCGQTFTRPNWKVWRETMYCSSDCYASARRALPPDERAALMSEATSRIRGNARSHDDLCRRAKGKQSNPRMSEDERTILAALNASGMFPIPQMAIDKFNVDFGFPAERLAVEYHGGNWHNTAKKIAGDSAKASYLHAHGWELMVFPRLDKPQNNDAGNVRIRIADLVNAVSAALILRRAA